MIESILRAGLSGYQSNLQRMDQAAKRLADPQTGVQVEDVVDLLLAEHGAKANLKVMKVAKSTEDSLLDVLA